MPGACVADVDDAWRVFPNLGDELLSRLRQSTFRTPAPVEADQERVVARRNRFGDCRSQDSCQTNWPSTFVTRLNIVVVNEDG